MPDHVKEVLAYNNVPADPTPGATENPLQQLIDLATPDDFVVMKIDIDNNPVEEAFIQQILSDERVHRCVSKQLICGFLTNKILLSMVFDF